MPREHPDYRNNLAILNERFPDYDMLDAKDVMAVYHYTSMNTVKKNFPFDEKTKKISKAALARIMCGEPKAG